MIVMAEKNMIIALFSVLLAWPASVQSVHSPMQYYLWIPTPNGLKIYLFKVHIQFHKQFQIIL